MKTMRTKSWSIGLVICLALGLGLGCSGKSTDGGGSLTKVALKFSDMMPEQRMFIDNSGVLELWVVRGGESTSLGQFRIDFNGRPVDRSGNVIEEFETSEDISTAARLTVTFESGDQSSQATGPVVMSAEIDGDSLGLRFAPGFDGLQGQYLVVTPSDGGGVPGVDEEDTTNANCGIWFSARDWGQPGLGLGLSLPPDGWRYESWLMYAEGSFLSMGKFDSVNELDDRNEFLSDLEADTALARYHFPGEDFLTNAPEGLTFPLDVRGHMTFVTMEPDPDPDPDTPFLFLTLFCKTVPGSIPSTTKSQALDAPPLPRATALLR